MQQINVVIVTRDALVAVGLRYILGSLFDIDARWEQSPRGLLEADTASVDLFLTDAESFAANPDFFIPRRSRLAVMAATDSTVMSIDRHADEKRLIRQLTQIVETTREKRSDGNDLSQREVDVLCLVARGLTNKEIADKLFISINTVLTHRKNISAKLGIRSVSGLSVYAMMNGYIAPGPAK